MGVFRGGGGGNNRAINRQYQEQLDMTKAQIERKRANLAKERVGILQSRQGQNWHSEPHL